MDVLPCSCLIVSFGENLIRQQHIQYVIIQADKPGFGEDEIEVLQGLCQPETLHVI